MSKTITIAKDFGCGAHELSRKLAKHLSYEYFDKALINDLALKMRSSAGELRSWDDGTALGLFKFMTKYMTSELVKTILSDEYGYVDDNTYREALGALINDLADRGNVVIVGRGSQCILRERDDVVRVRLIAPMEYKISLVAGTSGISEDEAEHTIKMHEERIHRYVEKLFCQYYNDPTLYHVTINLARVDHAQAIAMISDLV